MLLAIETSSLVSSVALLHEDTLKAELTIMMRCLLRSIRRISGWKSAVWKSVFVKLAGASLWNASIRTNSEERWRLVPLTRECPSSRCKRFWGIHRSIPPCSTLWWTRPMLRILIRRSWGDRQIRVCKLIDGIQIRGFVYSTNGENTLKKQSGILGFTRSEVDFD